MATDPELLKAEDSVKQKYLDIVADLSVKELKKFKKNEYQKLVLIDLMELLPDFEKSQLNETAHYVSNALNNSVQRLLPKKQRDPSINRKRSTVLLSDTVLEDLDTTMQPANSQIAVESELQPGLQHESEGDQSEMNDSITILKQTISSGTDTTDKGNKDNTSTKCCDGCTVKHKPRKSYSMTRCSLCVTWYHDQCVGLSKDEPVGVWLCVSCRQVPQGLQDSLVDIKTDVELLKETSESVITILKSLSAEVTTSIQSINDKLSALSKQINCNDKKVAESLETLNVASDNIKTGFEQKTCQILNKTTSIMDKIKHYNETPKLTPTNLVAGVTPTNNSNEKQNKSTDVTNVDRNAQKQLTTQKGASQNKQQPKKTNHKKTTNITDQHNINEDETIDLTKTATPKKQINQSTLLVGSSILKGVKTNDLNKNTAVRTFPGATIEKLQNKLNQYDISKCETIVVHVGGNDADEGTELDSFRLKYSSLLDELTSENRRVVVSGLLPRASVDLDPYNLCLKDLCNGQSVEFVDHYNGFLLASGDIADSYYHKDKLHLNSFGTQKLLRNLDAVHRVTRPNTSFQSAGQTRRNGSSAGVAGFQHKQRGYRNGRYLNGPRVNTQHHNGQKYCHICMISGHLTNDCWYNGRNTSMSGYFAH